MHGTARHILQERGHYNITLYDQYNIKYLKKVWLLNDEKTHRKWMFMSGASDTLSAFEYRLFCELVLGN